jgi:hypothetical protein
MARQPLARLNSGAALATPASNSGSMPGLMSICAISRTMPIHPMCCVYRLDVSRFADPVPLVGSVAMSVLGRTAVATAEALRNGWNCGAAMAPVAAATANS